MVADGRSRTLDFRVASSHLSFVFGHSSGRQFTSLVEAPMFVDSVLSAGIQLADILGGAIYGNYYHKKCFSVLGLFDGTRPVSIKMVENDPTRSWNTRLARNYSHCLQYWTELNSMQFRRSDVPPPISGGRYITAYYGFRVFSS